MAHRREGTNFAESEYVVPVPLRIERRAHVENVAVPEISVGALLQQERGLLYAVSGCPVSHIAPWSADMSTSLQAGLYGPT